MENKDWDIEDYLPKVDPRERKMAILAHLGIIAAFVFPLGNIGLPLIIYWREKNKSVYSSAEAKEALNFQITMTLMVALIIVLSFILIGFFFLAAWCVAQFYFTSQALDTVGQNEHYRYPINFRIIK